MLPLPLVRASLRNPLPYFVGAESHHPSDSDRPRSDPRTGPCPQRSFTDPKQLGHLLGVQQQMFVGDGLLRHGLDLRWRRLGWLRRWCWHWRRWADGWSRTGCRNRGFERLDQGLSQHVTPIGSVLDLDGDPGGDCQRATGRGGHGILLDVAGCQHGYTRVVIRRGRPQMILSLKSAICQNAPQHRFH